MVTSPHRIAGEAEQIADPQGLGAEQLGLQGNAIAIPTGQLQHRLYAGIQQQAADSQAAHPHHGPTAIGHIDGVHPAAQGSGGGQHSARVPPPGGHHLRSQSCRTAGQGLLELQTGPFVSTPIIGPHPAYT